MAATAAEVRAQVLAEGLTERRGWLAAGRTAVLIGAYVLVAAVAVAVDQWWSWLVAWWLLGFLLMGAGAVVHEALHGNLTNRDATNRLAGNVAAAVLLLPYEAYRGYHLAHHADTAVADDPEGDNTVTSRLLYVMLPVGGAWFWAEQWSHAMGGLRGRPPRWFRTDDQRRALRRSAIGAGLVLLGAVVGAAANPLVWRLWLVPVAVVMIVCLPVVFLPEHQGGYGMPRSNPLEVTRTVRSNAALRFVYWNTNFHTAHHFAPRVPAHRLGRLDELVEPLQPDGWRSRSYVAYHVRAWAALPWRSPITTDVVAPVSEVHAPG